MAETPSFVTEVWLCQNTVETIPISRFKCSQALIIVHRPADLTATANIQSLLLTKPLAGPPVWLLEGGELDVGVQPQPVVQVRCATLWLADDIEIRKAPHAVGFPIVMKHVISESVPQVLKNCTKAPRIVCI